MPRFMALMCLIPTLGGSALWEIVSVVMSVIDCAKHSCQEGREGAETFLNFGIAVV